MITTLAKGNKNSIIENLLAVSVFFLPLFQVVSLVSWVAILIVLLFTGKFETIASRLKRNPLFILFISLYVFYFAGMLWTTEYKPGLEDLRIKLPLLIFPVMFASIGVTNTMFRKTGIALIAGCSASVIICLVNSVRQFLGVHDPHVFFYTFFSIFQHPTYFTMYITLALLFVCSDGISENPLFVRNRSLLTFVFFFLTTAVILLNARLAMVTAGITLTFFVIAESWKQGRFKIILPRFVIYAFTVGVMFFMMLKINNRFVQISDAIQSNRDTTAVLDTSTHIYYNSTLIRIGLLKNSVEVFKEHFLFGVGTGDVMSATVSKLKESKFEYLAAHFTGAHNQYLQTAMTLGIFGLILLLLCVLYPLREYWIAKNFLGVGFLIIVFINGVGDTLLRASSIYFFVFFACFIYAWHRKEVEK